MLGKIGATCSLRKTLEYNEEKVIQQKAICLHAENFLKDADELTYKDKYNRLYDRVTLNERAEKKVAHIFLTFHPRDEISNNTMVQLAQRYMMTAGFGDHPYLIYRHLDTGNPHLHAVSTFVTPNRKMIKTPPRILQELKTLTQGMETELGLRPNIVKTDGEIKLQANWTQQVVYGQRSLKGAISNVLDAIIDHYKYTSIDELNAILSEYNVMADRGYEGTRMFQNKGLVYVALDKKGMQVSRGLWASTFDAKPTLPYLENKFSLNQSLRESQRARITTAIKWTFVGKPPDWTGFRETMEREGINIVVDKTKDKQTPGIYFIDHRGKSVFSGESLGPEFNLKAIRERCAPEQQLQESESQRNRLKIHL